jgi:hypothetical protein
MGLAAETWNRIARFEKDVKESISRHSLETIYSPGGEGVAARVLADVAVRAITGFCECYHNNRRAQVDR